jgi:hypothetical protein
MAAAATMQREAIPLTATVLVSVLALRGLRLLRRAARDERRQTGLVARLGLRRTRLLLLNVALLTRLILIIVACERLRVLLNVRLWFARAERLLAKVLAVLVAVLELLVGAGLELLLVAAFGTRLEIRVLLAELFLRGRDEPEIMLGMLEIILRRNVIAGRLRITSKLEIFLRNVIGGPANLHIRAVRFVNPCERILIAPVVLLIVVVAPAHTLVVMMLLTVSHGLLFNDS